MIACLLVFKVTLLHLVKILAKKIHNGCNLLLMGFFCDLDGDGTIHLDENELSHAAWYPRNNLPARDDGFSLTREMIRVFGKGREPK